MPSLVEIGPVVLEKIFIFRQCIFAIRKCLPLEKGVALYLNILEYPSPKDVLCRVWWILAQWFLKEDENMKSLDDDGRSEISA